MAITKYANFGHNIQNILICQWQEAAGNGNGGGGDAGGGRSQEAKGLR